MKPSEANFMLRSWFKLRLGGQVCLEKCGILWYNCNWLGFQFIIPFDAKFGQQKKDKITASINQSINPVADIIQSTEAIQVLSLNIYFFCTTQGKYNS